MAKLGRKKIDPRATRTEPRDNKRVPGDFVVEDGRLRRIPYAGPPTEQERKIIYSYACYGAIDADICTIMGMGLETLYKYFSDELREGRAVAHSKIAQRLYQIAVGRDELKDERGKVIQTERQANLSALIFLAKVRLGWKEIQVIESSETQKEVQIYIPDNGMREEIIEIKEKN